MYLLDRFYELTNHPFDRFKLLDHLDACCPDVYHRGVGVHEGYTLREHTAMVLLQFEKYFSSQPLPGGFSHSQFRLFLAIHDLGKPAAVANEEKHNQSRYNLTRFDEVYPQTPFIEGKERATLRSLLCEDPVGHYFKRVMRRGQTRTQALSHCVRTIKDMHIQQEALSFSDYFDLLLTYYRCDAGSYTMDAGGKLGLDHLFDFNGGRIDFRGEAKELIEHLSAAIAEA
jgi:hypothetical protein